VATKIQPKTNFSRLIQRFFALIPFISHATWHHPQGHSILHLYTKFRQYIFNGSRDTAQTRKPNDFFRFLFVCLCVCLFVGAGHKTWCMTHLSIVVYNCAK
jgi:hypothetical protein